MHVVIEKARQVAGISGMKKNYPDNPKQRGCGYWAAFIGSVGNDLASADSEQKTAASDHLKEIRTLHNRIEELEAELRHVKDHGVATGIEVLRQREQWTVEKGREALKIVAG